MPSLVSKELQEIFYLEKSKEIFVLQFPTFNYPIMMANSISLPT
jgi:hypothetical protein